MMGWYDHGSAVGWGGWLLMTLLMIAFWTAVVAGVIALWRAGHRQDRPVQDRGATGPAGPQGPAAPADPRQLLDERFARGEIEPDDYVRRRDLLGSGR